MGFTHILIFTFAGILAGLASRYAFLRMPDSWLLDYDQTEVPEGFAHLRSFPFLYQGIVFTILTALLFARIPAAVIGGWQVVSALIAIPVLLLILVADWKTRIIPDQLTLLLILPGVIRIIGEIAAGVSWFKAAGRPLIAAAIAGGSLLLIGLTGQLLMHREAMGMGDVKMIAATAFMIGLGDLLALVMLSFFTAALIAIPLLVRRIIRQKRASHEPAMQNECDALSKDVSDQSAVDKTTALSDMALTDAPEKAFDDKSDEAEDPEEDDTAIAFGPFIAIASLLLILFHQQIDQLATAYWSLIIR